MVQPLWGTVWRFVKKLKIELPYDPVIPVLGLYLEVNPKELKAGSQRDIYTAIFTACFVHIMYPMIGDNKGI